MKKVSPLLLLAFLVSSCAYKSVAVFPVMASDSVSIDAALVNPRPRREYTIKLKRPLPLMYGESVSMERSVRMIEISTTKTHVVGKRFWKMRSRRIEQLDSIPKIEVASIEREEVEVGRTLATILLFPIAVAGIVFLFLANGGRGF